MQSFETILNGAKNGEEWAWESIYRELAGPLTGYLAVRGAPEPEDQASETLFHVARNIDSFNGDEDSFRSWVFVIAHRRLIDARRKRSRTVETTSLESHHGEHGGDVEGEALDRLALDEINALLAPLTDEQRDVITLRMIADMSLEATAKVMGKRVGSIKALQRRAIANLKRQLETREVSQ